MNLFGFTPPVLREDEVARIAAERYGLVGAQVQLRGERSHNTLFTAADGSRFVLKIASADDPLATIDFHAKALVHLELRAPDLPVARMRPSLDGELVPVFERAGLHHGMRLVTFMPGHTFEDGQPVTTEGMRRIGALVGSVSDALADFEHPADATFMPWDVANGLIVDDELWSGLADDSRELLTPARARLELAQAKMATLPRQVIHNDAHVGNLLRSGPDSDLVTGVIDFGDLVRTVTVADLGVTGASLAPHQNDPVAAMAALASGFHERRPLSAAEKLAIPDVVLCRLALSTLMTDHQIARAPHIAGAVTAERPGVLSGLRRWLAIEHDRLVDAIEEATS
jgi:hydroxylysine kinase